VKKIHIREKEAFGGGNVFREKKGVSWNTDPLHTNTSLEEKEFSRRERKKSDEEKKGPVPLKTKLEQIVWGGKAGRNTGFCTRKGGIWKRGEKKN